MTLAWLFWSTLALARVPFLDPCGYPPPTEKFVNRPTAELRAAPCLPILQEWKIPLMTKKGELPGGVSTYYMIYARSSAAMSFFLRRMPSDTITDAMEFPLRGSFYGPASTCETDEDLARIALVETDFSLLPGPNRATRRWRVDTEHDRLVPEFPPPTLRCSPPFIK